MKDNEIKEYLSINKVDKDQRLYKKESYKKMTTSQTGMPDAIPLFLEANVPPITFLS